jgi:hypothetical protein
MNENECVPESGDFIVWNDSYKEITTVTADRDCVLPLRFWNVVSQEVDRYKRTISQQWRIMQDGSVLIVNNGTSVQTTAKFMKREEAALHKLGNVYDVPN